MARAGRASAGGPVVVTVAGSAGALPGTAAGSVKVSPYAEFPPKGRATGGVRCHRFLKGEDELILAWAGPGPALGATEAGGPVELPGPFGRRDGSGAGLSQPLAAVGGTLTAETAETRTGPGGAAFLGARRQAARRRVRGSGSHPSGRGEGR